MIKTLWNNLVNNIPLLITNVNSQTGILKQVVDLGVVQNRGDVASVELDVLTRAVAPGSTKTMKIWTAWSSSSLKSVADLAPSAASVTLALINSANTHQLYMVPQQAMAAQYLYIWFDHDALDAGATLELNLSVNGKTA